MFEIKLKIQKKFANWRLKSVREKTGNQVRENSIFSIISSSFLKLLILSFFGLIILLPFFFMIFVASMSKTQTETLNSQFSFFPEEWHLFENISAAVKGAKTNYWVAFAITFANVLFTIWLKIIITMLAGYAFSFKKWKGKEFIWACFIALLVLPEVALLSGQYKMYKYLNSALNLDKNFFGTVAAIAMPFVASIFNALMYRNAFEAIPSRIKEVAMVDGAVGAKYLFKIAMPMVRPTTLTIVILTALASWNSYIWPAMIAGNDYEIMSVWLFGVGLDPRDPEAKIFHKNLRMAGAICGVLPMLIFYFVFRKRIMAAISRQGSAIKG